MSERTASRATIMFVANAGEGRPIRFGVWNLDSTQARGRQAAQRTFLEDRADVWLLAEVHTLAVEGLECVPSAPVDWTEELRWAAIATRFGSSSTRRQSTRSWRWPVSPYQPDGPRLSRRRSSPGERQPGTGRRGILSRTWSGT